MNRACRPSATSAHSGYHDAPAQLRGNRGACIVPSTPPGAPGISKDTMRRITMQWIDPAYCDIRLGFEVTAYVYVR